MRWDIHEAVEQWYCFMEDIKLDCLKCFEVEMMALSSTSAQILKSVYDPGLNF